MNWFYYETSIHRQIKITPIRGLINVYDQDLSSLVRKED